MISDLNQAAHLVGCIGKSNFDQHFYSFCQELLNVEQCTAFHFAPHGSPHCLIAEANKRRVLDITRQLAQEYTEGAWKRDPNLSLPVPLPGQSAAGNDTMVCCVSPSHIRDLGYRRRFYDYAQVRQELTLIAQPEPHSHLYCSFYRGPRQPDFSHEDIAQLRHWGSLIAQVLNKHVSITRSDGEDAAAEAIPGAERRERMYQELRGSMLRLPCGLTQREADVCAAIALGYTTLGIGLNLGISVNTVATHRKRAYAKLGISCQNELFARYFDSLGNPRCLH